MAITKQTNAELLDQNPYANLFNDMMFSAKESRASDIHIQPERDSVKIRFRQFGEMVEWKRISEIHKFPFLQEAKRLSQCSLAISGRPQDTRFSLSDLKLDVRVNLVPTLFGEKLVLRLLDQTRSFNLSDTRLNPESIEAVQHAIQLNDGVCLFTGPTGSGKTTLLYSALHSLDQAKLNIVTIEDPVEYSISGVSQIQVSSKIGFADALRAVLRQDPDVILVGEVRDRETAELCFQAAATGHLVLSTLHANSAKDVFGRLQALGVRDDLITSCLRFSSAQRLLSELCPHCSLPVMDKDVSAMTGLGNNSTAQFRKRSRSGCSKCKQGLKGMVPVFEFIERSGSETTAKTSLSLRDSTLAAAKKGLIDVYEIPFA